MDDNIKKDTQPAASGFKTARLDPGPGLSAVVAKNLSDGTTIETSQWSALLWEFKSIDKNPEKVIRHGSSGEVLIKQLSLAGRNIKTVIKTQNIKPGPVNFVKAISGSKAVKNFRTAAKLRTAGINTIYPLAAVEQKLGPAAIKSILITEYLENSINLHGFLTEMPAKHNALDMKNQLCLELARIFAELHSLDMWHRDSKASNFVVTQTEHGLKVHLADMDGIMPYLYNKDAKQVRTLAKLASRIMFNPGIHITDYYRFMKTYCGKCGLSDARRKILFKKTAENALAQRLLTAVTSADKQRNKSA